MNPKIKFTLIAVLLAAIFVGISNSLPAKDMAIELIARVRSFGVLAPVAFFLFYIVAAVAGVSRTLLNVIAGIVFEPVVAVMVVLLSAMTAFMCTFFIARFFAADRVAARLKRIPVAGMLMDAVEQHGFRLLVLMRMNPFVPGFVNGYGFGLTSMKALPYFVASVIGSVPLSLIHIYLGWAGGEAMLRASGEMDKLQTGTLWSGVVLSVILLTFLSWYGHRAIASANKISSTRPGNQSSPG